MSIPQLRIRTEYSFRSAYGTADQIASRLKNIDCDTAGLIDTHGTWGAISWEKAMKDLSPMYGAEFSLPDVRGVYWALATDLKKFYRFSSNPPKTKDELKVRDGIIVFAGSALTDPETFDYIDINPRSMLKTKQALALSKKTGKPVVVTSDNDYPSPEDEQRFLAWADSKKVTPQYILSDDELRDAFSFIPSRQWKTFVENTYEAASRCVGLVHDRAPIISVSGSLRQKVAAGKKMRLERGHIKEWTAEYDARLKREMKLIAEKSFESYFLVVSDLIVWAKERMLVGPGRGSSAGSLVCYLLQITEVDPLVHNLIFERFIDVNRNDLPDIDIDFNDKKRDLVFEYLSKKYGADNTARIGSINRLKPRSVIAHVSKKLGIPHGAAFGVLNVLIEYSSGDSRYGKCLEDTLTTTQPGKDFMEKYPEAKLMAELEEVASHTGVHAAGFIVSNVDVVEYCTVRDGVAQIDKKDAEYLNLLKIDILGLRTLGVIEDSDCVTSQQLYDLKLDDQEVFGIFNDHKFSGIFQFEGAAQRRVSVQIPVTSFQQIDHITALSRPGPLGGGAANTYIQRHRGVLQTTYHHPSMKEYLEDTYGVVLYQEQVMKIVREIGQFSWEDTSIIRKAMSGRKGKEYFDQNGKKFAKGAKAKGINSEDAEAIWNEIVSFGAWGMNKSHTVSYSIVSYWCAYMKRYHALEYAAACLRNAKDDEQTVEILRELRDEGVKYTPFDIQLSGVDWCVNDGKLVGGFKNLVGIGPVKAAFYVNKKETTGLSEKDVAAINKCKLKHQDLSTAHTLWGDMYKNPGNYNVVGKIKEFAELEDFEDAVVICQLLRINRRDENEAVRANKRGNIKRGQTLFADAFVVDDSISKPVLLRIKCHQWHAYGVKMVDRAIPKQDWFLVRGKWLKQFSMLTMTKIKCLTNKELFS